MKYSVTSVILPDLDVMASCRLLQELGYDGIEWRVRYTDAAAKGKGYSIWGEHKADLSPDNLAERADELLRITSDHGLQIPCIASAAQADDLEQIKRLADGVARMGEIPVRLIAPRGYDGSEPYPDLYEQALAAFAEAVEFLRPYGIKILIEIHSGTILPSASTAHRIASNFTPEEMGVIYDVNNMAKDGFETFRLGLELLGPYLAHCHAGGWWPKAVGRRDDGALDWGYEGCDLADSILDIPRFMGDLKAVGYQGFISIEDFREMDHRQKLRRQIEYLRTIEWPCALNKP
ncbi:MAG: TIM barrel protein [Nitrospiraceae bacterium]|nr:TIM barrel protein [Nitrospiraceae bacterium]